MANSMSLINYTCVPRSIVLANNRTDSSLNNIPNLTKFPRIFLLYVSIGNISLYLNFYFPYKLIIQINFTTILIFENNLNCPNH